MTTAEVCRRHGISSATFYAWKSKYGRLEVSEAKGLKTLEDENRKHTSLDGLTPNEFAMRSTSDHHQNGLQL